MTTVVGRPGGPGTSAATDDEGLRLLVEVAHDMRSPLGSILLLVDRLKRIHARSAAERDPAERRLLELIHSATAGLSALVTDVMELVRGGERLLAAPEEAVAPAALLSRVAAVVAPLAEERGLALVVGGAAPGELRRVRAAAVERLLLNLATNAVKFTPAGMVTLDARALAGDRVRFTVADTGPGIPPRVLAELFEPFRADERGAMAFSAAGLGLKICRALVEGLGGALEVRTVEGGGTTFCVELELPRAA